MNWAQAHREGAVAATYCHDDYGVDTTQQIDVFSVLASQGILTAFRPLPRLSGAYFPGGGRPGVLLNANHPLSRQRYSAAHELGHHYREHGTCVDPEIEALHRWGTRSPPAREKVAEAFACWFLMPRQLVLSILDRHDTELTTPADAYALSLRLGTSYEATTRHLVNLRLVSRSVAERWLATEPRTIKRELAGDWAPPNIRSDVWIAGTADEGMAVTVTPGDRIIVQVPEVPSSGYCWSPIDASRSEGVTQIGEDYQKATEPSLLSDETEVEPLVGGSAEHRIVFEVDEDAPEGTRELSFVHAQPWQPDSQTDQFELAIRVRHYRQGIDESYFLEPAA